MVPLTKPRLLRSLLASAGLFVVLAGSSLAHAADAISDEARTHFKAGVSLLQDPEGERVEEAYREFKAAYAISKSPKILGNMGFCAMRLERDGEAIEAYSQYLREVPDIDADERRVPLPANWEQATQMVAELNRNQFPAIRDKHWPEIARQFYNEKNGRPAPGYDAKLGKALSVLDGPKRVPLMVIRGELSDLLSEATVEEMRRRHPNCVAVTVEGQGHAPMLKDVPSIRAVRRFLAAADEGVKVNELALV
jgi:pimeloyl-ACP methyl ester carboxylesterase